MNECDMAKGHDRMGQESLISRHERTCEVISLRRRYRTRFRGRRRSATFLPSTLDLRGGCSSIARRAVPTIMTLDSARMGVQTPIPGRATTVGKRVIWYLTLTVSPPPSTAPALAAFTARPVVFVRGVRMPASACRRELIASGPCLLLRCGRRTGTSPPARPLRRGRRKGALRRNNAHYWRSFPATL